MQAVRNRSTTRKDDESIILADIFEMDTKRLTGIGGEQRMRVFYEEMGYVPTHWLFLGLTNIDIPNSEWAPGTLRLEDVVGGLDHLPPGWKNDYGKVTPRGLVCCLPMTTMDQTHPLPIDNLFVEYESVFREGRLYCMIAPVFLEDSGPVRFEQTHWVKDLGWDAILLDAIVVDGTRANALPLKSLSEIDCSSGLAGAYLFRVVANVRVIFKPREWFESVYTPEPLIVPHTGRHTALATVTLV